MSVIAAALKHMLAANMPHDAILAAVEDMERGLQTDEQAERRRAADRERQRIRRLRSPQTSADKVDSPRVGVTHVEEKPLTQKIEPQESKKVSSAQSDVAAFRAGLTPDVPVEIIEEFIKVRRKKRGAITGFAAQLFREDAGKVGMSVTEAARECVRSSWITVKPEYFPGRPRAGPALPKPNPGLAAVDALMEKIDAVTPSETDPSSTHLRLVASAVG